MPADDRQTMVDDTHPSSHNQPRIVCMGWLVKHGRSASDYKRGGIEPRMETGVLGIDGYKDKTRLQNKALLVAALAGGARHESSAGGVLKDLANTAASSSRALQVLVRTDLLGNSLSLYKWECQFRQSKSSVQAECTHVRRGNRLLVGCPQGLDGVGVVSQIGLAAD